MNIIIVGCGKVGKNLAEQLSEGGNNITVIDNRPDHVSDTTERYDVLGVVGNGASHAVLEEAGINNANLLIAVTGSDEQNLLCCLIAKKAGGCQTIARVRNPQYYAEAPYLKEELGLAMVINPEREAAEEIARILRFPSAIKIDTFVKGKIELLKFKLPEDSPLCGMAVREIAPKLHCDLLVCTIERGEETFIAYGDFCFQAKDIVSLIADPKTAITFFRKIKHKASPVKDVLIAGGGDITHYLCKSLEKTGIGITVIEKEQKRADALSDTLDNVNVILADAINQEILMQENLDKKDAFVSLTNLDEENILLSLYARSVSQGKIITKINRIDFDQVIDRLDLDTIIYPKNLTSNHIIRYVRAMKKTIGTNLETLYQIIKGKVEAAEFIVADECPLTSAPLMELKFKEGVLVAAIFRNHKVLIPRGSDRIQVGDSVVIVTNQMGLHDINDILR
ncbi:MAG: Trk system potassium transporter TrkA [Oscillospiraceae bacterium]|nr:Trk system potassium transporter TrkA [Oscillospiraceae bacterium]